MNVAFGLKAHSGWAALVVLGKGDRPFEVIERGRMELVDRGDASWAKQPYHAAENLPPSEARRLVQRGVDAAQRHALQEIRTAVMRAARAGHVVSACAVLTGQPMPEWTVDEILAVHFRMHKAEGVLFRDALARAAIECGQRLVPIPEKQLHDHASRVLAASPDALVERIDAIGKCVGPPWGKDQKDAALAAMVALAGVGLQRAPGPRRYER
jgi:hypothetical protein